MEDYASPGGFKRVELTDRRNQASAKPGERDQALEPKAFGTH